MSLADDHKAESALLNRDIFAAVIDQVIGWLNTYKTNDIIRFAGVLRLVCQYANIRIQPIARCYLDVVSRKHLARLVMLGSPNTRYLRSLTIRISPPTSLLNAFFIDYTAFNALQCLRVDDHANPVAVPAAARPGWFMQYPPSLTELSVITSSKPIAEGFGRLFQNPNTRVSPRVPLKKLALFGVPVRHLPRAVEQLALAVQATDDDLRTFCDMGEWPGIGLRNIRLLFLSSQSTADHRALLSLLWRMPEHVVVEELQSDGDNLVGWFAEHVEDGTIWTVPAVNLRGMPISA